MMFNNTKFYLYTKLINYFLKRKSFDQVDYWLKKKKDVAKEIRESLKIKS